MNPRVLGVIPSRYGSMRLPGKPLKLIHGKPMVQWVYESAHAAIKQVVVATDDARIVKAVESFGGRALLTPRDCQSGTERMAYVAKKMKASFYVNIQGDEPLIDPRSIKSAVQLSLKTQQIATAATPYPPKERFNPGFVKVLLKKNGEAIYFSRALIPFPAHGVGRPLMPFKHLGLYVYPRKQLLKFVSLPATSLEKTEKLEQLRAVYYGMPIHVVLTPYDSMGVDTQRDLDAVRKILSHKNKLGQTKEYK